MNIFEKLRKRKLIKQILSDTPPEGYDVTRVPIEAKWYHRIFLWLFKEKTVEEFPVVYHYKTVFGKNYFMKWKNVFVNRPPMCRAERRRLERELMSLNRGDPQIARGIRKDQYERLEEVIKS